jgi:ABC-type transport system involved in cytochrome c biogenesis permease subunit
MSSAARFLPWFAAIPAAFYLLMAAAPPEDSKGQMQIQEFGKLPVVDGGRVKPFDTFARTTLMVINNRQTFKDDSGKEQPAIRWVLDVMSSIMPESKQHPEKYEVFRIENDQVLDLLGLEPRPNWFRYSINDFAGKLDKLEERAARAQELRQQNPNQLDLFDQKVLELAEHLQLYIQLAKLKAPLAVPPQGGQAEWLPIMDAVAESRHSGQENADARALGSMVLAYAQGNVEAFNRELASYRGRLDQQMPEELNKASLETFFNHFAPFYQCTLLYVLVFLLGCAAWMVAPRGLNRAAFWLAVVTLVVHTWALGTRMYLQGRPPVTNLYSAVVFIGWGSIILSLILESIYRNGLGNVVGAAIGALTMLLAHHLAGSGDTLEMMQAVLDTNFWLATHVTVVTTGYTATLVAGFLGIAYVIMGVFTTALTRDWIKTLSQMIYGVLCFATFLSFTGTVLGGIWADQSWGRFWGWDPKENGALLIVLMNALILHARWAGMIKQRGMAVLAIAGNMIVGWSGVGTNQLGVGLHAYGFNNTLALGLTVFWAVQLVFIGLGLLPLRYWRSFGPKQPAARPQKKELVPAG